MTRYTKHVIAIALLLVTVTSTTDTQPTNDNGWLVTRAGWAGITRIDAPLPDSVGMMRWSNRTGFNYPDGTRYVWFSIIYDDGSVIHVYRADKCFGLWTEANEIGKDGHYHVERQGWWYDCHALQVWITQQTE